MASSDPVIRYHLPAARRASRRWHVPVAVILAVLKQEGGTSADGKPVAPGDGAGPPSFSQATFGTGRSHGVKYGDSNSEVNFVAQYLVENGYARDARRAIGAYNGGPGNPQYDYADDVLAIAADYRKTLGQLPAGFGAAPGPAVGNTASSSSGALFGTEERSGALRALLWVCFTLGGFAIAGMGVQRLTGQGARA